MKNKLILLSFMLLSFMLLKVDVYAEATYATSSDSNFSTLKAQYDKGIQSNEIANSQMITLYGKSVCSGTSCSVTYAGGLTSFEDAIAKSVSCSNGQKYVIYQNGGTGKTDFSSDNKAGLSGTAYWSEEYQITCTTESTGNYTVTLEDSSSGSSNVSNTDNGSTNTENSYSSSTTVENPQQGVNTYFIVLGIAAIVSYGIMLFVKKFNLFKNI